MIAQNEYSKLVLIAAIAAGSDKHLGIELLNEDWVVLLQRAIYSVCSKSDHMQGCPDGARGRADSFCNSGQEDSGRFLTHPLKQHAPTAHYCHFCHIESVARNRRKEGGT